MDRKQDQSLLRPVTEETRKEVRALIASARHAALAVVEPGTGHPACSRVGLATLEDGTPIILVSGIAAHTAALDADPRCSLLVGEPGRGDPLAHPRVGLTCVAEPIAREGDLYAAARQRYLAAHPKASLYVDLPDFRFLALRIERASFNAGFGRAYALSGADIVTAGPGPSG